jgi:hypothetical protein
VQCLSIGIRWALQNGKWTFGVQPISGLMRAVNRYTLEGLSQNIVTPCLVLDAENDHFLKGQPEDFRRSLHFKHDSSVCEGMRAVTHTVIKVLSFGYIKLSLITWKHALSRMKYHDCFQAVLSLHHSL